MPDSTTEIKGPATEAGRRLARAFEDYRAGASVVRLWESADQVVMDGTLTQIPAIEAEAAAAERAAIRAAIVPLDRDYALHEESISKSDNWTNDELDTYSATVAGVLRVLEFRDSQP